MDVLILGYSNVFRNRILPVLQRLEFVDAVHIAKYELGTWDENAAKAEKVTELYDDYETGLKNFKGKLVYISTTNNSHYLWAKKSLEYGFNTVVDKPATMNLTESQELVAMARSKNLLLAESTVYLNHPQFTVLGDFMKENKLKADHITFLFSFPPMDPSNFRYSKKMGGGAVSDTSPYIASIGRFFFGELPESVTVKKNSDNGDVETSYSFLLSYPNGKSLVGHSGFTTEYVNRINVLGKDLCIDIDRVFTLPENIENTIKIRSRNESRDLLAPKANMFYEYFLEIEKCLTSGSFEKFYEDLLHDAFVREQLMKNSN